MAQMEFQARSEFLDDGTCVVSVAGEVDLYTAPDLAQALELNGSAGGRVVLDLSDCTFIDSTGLGVLIDARRRLGAEVLSIVAASVEVIRAFELTRLDRHFVLHSTLGSALNGSAANGWHDNEARSQAVFREVNERIEQIADGFDRDGHDWLICECGNPGCVQPIHLTRAEYEHVRQHASRFVVAHNHENPETESIVEENERFVVVETYAGTTSRIARETDPRSQRRLRARQSGPEESGVEA